MPNRIFAICTICFLIAAIISSSIASIIVGSEATSDCSSHAVMPLPKWLIIYGVFNFIALASILIASAIMWKLRVHESRENWGVMFVGFSLLTSLWSLVGAMSLFRDASACYDEDHAIWSMTLHMLIFQWTLLPLSFVVWCMY
jgi:hypothetical protein